MIRLFRWWWGRWKLARGQCSQCRAVLRDDDPFNGVCSGKCDEERMFMAAW